jgi:hypothetical protein
MIIGMSVRTVWIPAFGFIVSALAVGLPYFLTPYRELNLPNALYGPGLFVLVATGLLRRTHDVLHMFRRARCAASGGTRPVGMWRRRAPSRRFGADDLRRHRNHCLDQSLNV